MNHIKSWKEKKVEAICSQCGKVITMRQDSFFDNKRNHNGVFICRDCGVEIYKNSEDRNDTIVYVYGDQEEKFKKRIRKRNLLLLNSPKNWRGSFPTEKDSTKNLEIKCMKCGYKWMDSVAAINKGRSCPICSEVQKEKNKLEKINE